MSEFIVCYVLILFLFSTRACSFFFSGQIPDDAAWTKLRYINLNNNSFNGTISETFFSKENLTNIYFTNNTLSGTIPSNYGSAFALRDLWLNGNELTGEWNSTTI
jgi:hypothetical protein